MALQTARGRGTSRQYNEKDSDSDSSNDDSYNGQSFDDEAATNAEYEAQMQVILDEQADEENQSNAVPFPEYNEPEIIDTNNIYANLDIEDNEVMDSDLGDGDLSSSSTVKPDGIMQQVLWAVHERIREETKEKGSRHQDKWLLRHLKKNGWWIDRDAMPGTCKQDTMLLVFSITIVILQLTQRSCKTTQADSASQVIL